MANGIKLDWNEISNELEERKKNATKREPKISLGKGPKFSTSEGTASQDIARYYSGVDTSKLSPFAIETMGGEKKIAEQKEAANKLIESEATSNKPLSIAGTKPTEVKPSPKTEEKAEEPKRLWRVMMKGGDPSEDTFYDTKEAADAALKAMGGNGAVAGIRFPAKSKEEESALKERYMQEANIRGKVAMPIQAGETEEERIKRKISEVNPQATEEQKARYLETLSKSRARGRERGGYAEEYQADVAKGKVPTPYEERVMAEDARDRRMSDFITRSLARDAAKEKEKSFQSKYNYLKQIEKSARRSGQFGAALDAKRQLEDLSGSLGSNAISATARQKLFENEAMESARRNIEARDRLRKEKLYKSITSNPEASSPSEIYF